MVQLSKDQVDDFWRDGAICVRQAYSPEWISKITALIDDIIGRPSVAYGPRNPDANEYMDANTWLHEDAMLDFVLNGPGAGIAQQLFGGGRVNFFYDQMFVKEKLSPSPTPWHHDYTFWPVKGNQILSMWASVDPVNAESSALEFVAGSHLWDEEFRAIGTGGIDVTTGEEGLSELPDMEKDRDKYDVLSWELEPGDVLVFHARTLHGARGNISSSNKRRALAMRWCGDDATYRPGRGGELFDHDLKDGDPFSCTIYPQILPDVIDEQLAPRLAGPIYPSQTRLAKLREKMKNAKFEEVKPDPAVMAARA